MESANLLQAVNEVLDQGEALLLGLADHHYGQKLPVAFNASIGGHYRHCLDHFQSLLDAMATAEVDYDKRKRDARLEYDRFLALHETRKLKFAFNLLLGKFSDCPIAARYKVGYAAESSVCGPSSVARETMYAIGHAIHHYALIAVMCGLLGVQLPAGFGFAPSTLQHEVETKAA